MSLSKEHKGELLILFESILWGLFPVITILSYSALGPFGVAGISTLISAVFFGCMLTARKSWNQLLIKSAWSDILITTFFIGIIFYSLIFIGFDHTSAGNGGIILLMEIFFSFVILSIILKYEPIIPVHVIGACFMVIGALFILLPKSSGWHMGDFIIMGATVFPPIGNMYAKKARKKVNTEVIYFYRAIICGIFFLIMSYLFKEELSISAIEPSLVFLLINGLLLLGLSKILWLESVNLIRITKAISLTSISPFFTLLFAFMFLKESPTLVQVSGLIPMVVGIWLITYRKKLSLPLSIVRFLRRLRR